MPKTRKTIEVVGAKQNNLKNINVHIPLDKLTVITGVSGSGKSSLAFDVIYGEAQRRFMKSVSNYAKRRIDQMKKPNVDYVRGLSPVIAIEQKKGNKNPRSTVGTVTDINDYLRLLFATAGTGRCPVCGAVLQPVSSARIAECISSLPQGTAVSLYTAVQKIYGEDYDYLFEKIRRKGYKNLLIDGGSYNLAEKPYELDEAKAYRIEILLDRFSVRSELYLQIAKSVEAAINVLEDEVMLRIETPVRSAALENLGCPEHHYLLTTLRQHHFSFNTPESACGTCLGVGSSHVAQPQFFIVNPKKSILQGALHSVLFNPHAANSYRTVLVYSIAKKYGFSLDTPFDEYPEQVRTVLFYGTGGEPVPMVQPPFVEKRNWIVGRNVPFYGFVQEMESWYRKYIHKAGNSDMYEPSFVRDAMVEKTCPDCNGSRLKASRLQITVGGKNIHELSTMPFPDLINFLNRLDFPKTQREVVLPVIHEITSRLQLLVNIGLSYLSLSRRSDSLSGGEMQRIKMSTQISSELRGILYVMDEPSIGLHPRDSGKIIQIMKQLRDIGNTVIVVEHDLGTMRAADYLVEVGPGAGKNGGEIVAAGTPEEFMKNENCLSGAYMAGRRELPLPECRRRPGDKKNTLRGACAHNLKNITIDIPLERFVCVTGVSGSGKSSLIFETLSKNLEVIKHGARIIPGILTIFPVPARLGTSSPLTSPPSAGTANRIQRHTSGFTTASAPFSRRRPTRLPKDIRRLISA